MRRRADAREKTKKMKDDEANRLSARAARYLAVGAQAGGFAARLAGARFLGRDGGREGEAEALARALGGLKGPLMKAAQLLATIPEALPVEYSQALATLQSEAPPMGAAFVRRRMAAELGPGWRENFAALRPPSRRRRLARPGPSRPHARRRRTRLQAAISRHGFGGRSRSRPARHGSGAAKAHRAGDRRARGGG